MHAVDHFQSGEAGVADFGVLQALRNDANDLATGGHGGIRHHAHQAYGTAPVDEANTVGGQGATEILGGLFINGLVPRLAPQKTQMERRDIGYPLVGLAAKVTPPRLTGQEQCPWTERRLIALAQHPAAAEA